MMDRTKKDIRMRGGNDLFTMDRTKKEIRMGRRSLQSLN
jgi:hypothetical protein